jgi:hypothetical protein
MEPVVAHYAAQSERAQRLAEIARTVPALATLHQEKLASWHDLVAPEIARRLGADPGDPTDPRPGALIAAAHACLEAAVAAWIAGHGTKQLSQILHRAMDSIAYDQGRLRTPFLSTPQSTVGRMSELGGPSCAVAGSDGFSDLRPAAQGTSR